MRLFIALCFILLVLDSCHPSKKIVQTPATSLPTVDSVIQKLEHRQKFGSVLMKGDMYLKKDDEEQRGTFQIQIKEDSIFLISIRKFGFEAFRAVINKDSLYIIDRLNQLFYKYSIKDATELYNIPIDINFIADVLIGNASISRDLNYTVQKNNEEVELIGESETLQTQQIIKMPGMTPITFSAVQAERDLQVSFNNHKIIQNHSLAQQIIFQVNQLNKEFLTVQMDFSYIDFSPKLKYRFDVPGHYTLITK
ncbi:MAG: DUF4292 domain-containing protein [Bacteroidota bacterium]|nr:DUF4292 domain-containing protein [Bacteroidota bacterium]